jgi:hypothetical protein
MNSRTKTVPQVRMTTPGLQGTARQYGLNWKSVATIVKRAVQYGLRHRARPPVNIIGIDEVSRRKGQVYLTVVYDLERCVFSFLIRRRLPERRFGPTSSWPAIRSTPGQEFNGMRCDLRTPGLGTIAEQICVDADIDITRCPRLVPYLPADVRGFELETWRQSLLSLPDSRPRSMKLRSYGAVPPGPRNRRP